MAKGLIEQGSLYSPDMSVHHDVDRMLGYPLKWGNTEFEKYLEKIEVEKIFPK